MTPGLPPHESSRSLRIASVRAGSISGSRSASVFPDQLLGRAPRR